MKKIISLLFILLALIIIFSSGSNLIGLAADPTPEPETASENRDYLYDPTFLGSDFTREVASETIVSDEQPYLMDGIALARHVYQAIPDDNFEIFVGGSGLYETQLTNDPASDVLPRLNRVSTKIAFVSNSALDYEINVMNIDIND